MKLLCDIFNPKANAPTDIWQEVFPVRFGEIDGSDRVTLSSIFRFFQEAAINHAENLNVGRDDFMKIGRGWVLSRMSVIAERRPKYRETLTLRTWPRGDEKLFVFRNYDLRDKDDIPVVSARSGWLFVDIEKRRPLRPEAVRDILPANEGKETLPPEANGAGAVEERDDLQKVTERKALYTDIDYNGHVNNIRYIQWIEDALDRNLLEKADKIRLDINYVSEVLGGEVVDIFSARTDPETYAFEGRKKENAGTAFRAKIRLTQ